MPTDFLNQQADICLKKTELYIPLSVSLLGLVGAGLLLLENLEIIHIFGGTLLIGISLYGFGRTTILIFQEIEQVRWVHRKGVILYNKDKNKKLCSVCDNFPSMNSLFNVSETFSYMGMCLILFSTVFFFTLISWYIINYINLGIV